MSNTGELYKGTVVYNREVAPGHFLISVSLPGAFPRPKPGNFAMVKPAGRSSVLLPRPLSIYGYQDSRDGRRISLFYRVMGRGTEEISLLQEGEAIDLLGPLGSCFTLPDGINRILLVAGGMGIAPLTFLAASINNGDPGGPGRQKIEIVGYAGAQSADRLIGIEELQKNCSQVMVSTDDGSAGCSGLVTDMFLNDIVDCGSEETAVYACGPEPMIRCIAEMIAGRDVFCQVSVEQRMACGIGACLGCAVRVKSGSAAPVYKRTCREGPVFDIEELVFDP